MAAKRNRKRPARQTCPDGASTRRLLPDVRTGGLRCARPLFFVRVRVAQDAKQILRRCSQFAAHDSARLLGRFFIATSLVGFYNGRREFGFWRSPSREAISD